MRKMWIGTDVLRFCSGSQDRIDALAFAILIKQAYVNSSIKDATHRKLKEVLHVGSGTLARVIPNGVRYGFLRWDGKDLVANKIHGAKALSYMVRGRDFAMARNKSKNKRLTLAAARGIVEAAIVVNQVRMQNDCTDTHNRATFGETAAKVRRARKRESRMLCGKSYDDGYTGLSNKRIQQLIARKHGKAVKTIKYAVKAGLLSRQVREREFHVMGEAYTSVMRAMVKDQNIIVWVEKRCARIRLSNTYKYLGNNIRVANHGA